MFSEICSPIKYFSEVLGYKKSSLSSIKIGRSLFLLVYYTMFRNYKMVRFYSKNGEIGHSDIITAVFFNPLLPLYLPLM